MKRLLLTTTTALFALTALLTPSLASPASFCLTPETITEKFLHSDNLVLGPVQLLLPKARADQPVYVWLTGVGTIVATFDEEDCQVSSVIKPGIRLGRYLIAEFSMDDI